MTYHHADTGPSEDAYNYVFKNFFKCQPDKIKLKNLKVLELGSFNINGGIRDFNGGIRDFIEPWCQEYVGLDLQDGPGVDVVMSLHEYSKPNYFDFVVTTETFQHIEHWRETLMVSWENLVPGGFVIGTMAGEGRAPHSALDEKPIRDWEYYANIGEWDLRWFLKKAGFPDDNIWVNRRYEDKYVITNRRNAAIRFIALK